jgi:anti-sigma28 factor (negative regulator of flagellin synthesis)
MAIAEISGSTGAQEPTKSSKTRTGEKSKSSSGDSKDRVQLSSAARSMYEAGQVARLDAIRERVQSGFYLQPDVTEKVVDAILKDLKHESGE